MSRFFVFISLPVSTRKLQGCSNSLDDEKLSARIARNVQLATARKDQTSGPNALTRRRAAGEVLSFDDRFVRRPIYIGSG